LTFTPADFDSEAGPRAQGFPGRRPGLFWVLL